MYIFGSYNRFKYLVKLLPHFSIIIVKKSYIKIKLLKCLIWKLLLCIIIIINTRNITMFVNIFRTMLLLTVNCDC